VFDEAILAMNEKHSAVTERLLVQNSFFAHAKTWENAMNFPLVVHLGFCHAKSEKLMKVRRWGFIYFS
tara:strand:- start:9 stop:212 length:204 start_codon:yes stop_codon:yes gene_type:complete